MSTTTVIGSHNDHVLNCGHTVRDKRERNVGSQVRCPQCSDTAGKVVRPRITSTGPLAMDDADRVTPDPAPTMVVDDQAQRIADAEAEVDSNVASIDAFLASSPAKARMARYEAAKAAAKAGGNAADVLATPVGSTAPKARKPRNPDRRTGLKLSPVRRQAITAALGEAVGDVLADGNGPDPLATDHINLNQAQVDTLHGALQTVCDADEGVFPGPVAKAACRTAAWLGKFTS